MYIVLSSLTPHKVDTWLQLMTVLVVCVTKGASYEELVQSEDAFS